MLLFVLYFQKLESSQQSKVLDGEIQLARTPLFVHSGITSRLILLSIVLCKT